MFPFLCFVSKEGSLFHLLLASYYLLICILGGTCEAWFGGRESSASGESRINGSVSMSTRKRSPLNVDFFGSVCYTFQHGRFRKLHGDLTRVDARLDICSASALAKKVFNIFSASVGSADNQLSSPRLNLILQQQVLSFLYFIAFHILKSQIIGINV